MFGKEFPKRRYFRPCCRLWHYCEVGAWYAYNGDKIGQGRENAKTYLRENPLVCEEVEAKVREKFQLDGTAEETDAEESQKY
ncbi:MAG: hypothetical protein ACLR78_10500 [Roseburia sp.]